MYECITLVFNVMRQKQNEVIVTFNAAADLYQGWEPVAFEMLLNYNTQQFQLA